METTLRIAHEDPPRTRAEVLDDVYLACRTALGISTPERLIAAGFNGLSALQATAVLIRTRLLGLLDELIGTYSRGIRDFMEQRVETVEERLRRKHEAQENDPVRESLIAAVHDQRNIDEILLDEYLGEIRATRFFALAIAEVFSLEFTT